ncbi:MAG: hypothetical protein MZU95_06870 [Desulfomicrobium escambiense]|nr:hypothetical protein [Desulfomicrobium escambiense]
MITVEVRTPFLVLERGGALWLADAEGRVLEPVYALDEYGLPVVSDDGRVRLRFLREMGGGRPLLPEPAPATKAGRLAAIRCGDFGTLELALQGRSRPRRRRRRVPGRGPGPVPEPAGRAGRASSGRLALVNMGFDGRIYVRAAEPAGDDVPQPDQGD